MQIIELYPVSGQESAQPRRIPSVAFELDGDKRWLYLSPNATELLGLNPVHLLGTSLFLAIDPENHLEVLDLFSRFSRTPFHGPAAFTFKNLQTHRPVSMSIQCVYDDSRRPVRYYGQMSTAEEGPQRMSAGRDSVYQLLFQGIPAGLLLFDSSGQFEEANARALQLLGLETAASLSGYRLLEDFGLAQSSIDDLLAGKPARGKSEISIPSGNANPSPIHVQAVTFTVTPLKERPNEQKYLLQLGENAAPEAPARGSDGALPDLLLNQVGDGICIFDPQIMRIHRANASFERMLGYDAGALRDLPLQLVLHEREETLHKQIAELYLVGSWEKASHRYIRKDGSMFETPVSAMRITVEGNNLIALFVRGRGGAEESQPASRRFEEHFRNFKDSINDVLYRYNVKEDTYEFITPSILLQTGYTEKEFTTNSKEITEKTTYADDLPLVHHRIRQHLTKGPGCGPVELQYRFIKKDGSVIWISDQKSFEFDADGTVAKVNGVMRDISRQKAIEIQLRDSEEYFRTMFESSPDGLVIFDLPLSRLEINRQFTHLFGYEQYEFSELPWQILERVPPNIIQARLDRLEREGHVEYNAIHFTKSGKVLYCNVKCSRFHTSKGPLYCAVVRDMTEKRSLEFQLQQYSQQLEKLVEQRTQQLTYYSERLENMVNERTAKLESANKELEQFAYTISHDLRAPLICIEGFSNLLRDEVQDKVQAEQRDWIDIIISSTKRMNQLIADILELARIGRVVGQRAEVHIVELLDDIRQEFLLTFEKRRVTLTQDAAFPPLVTDLQRLRQVFQNLISNAIKYNDKEEVDIDVHALEREREVELIVSDNGVGIPADRREDIFGLFKRLHTDEEVEGTGAGLAIVKKIVESLGGRIWVDGEVGAGSAFHFTIPKQSPDEPED